MARFSQVGLGWHPDLPDFRDLTIRSPAAVELLDLLPEPSVPGKPRSARVDLRGYFPAVSEPRPEAASTASACLNLFEYFERRAYGRIQPLSQAFLDYTTRRLPDATGDGAASLRTALKALKRFGVVPARYWDHSSHQHGPEPDSFIFALADAEPSLSYLRLDGRQASGGETLDLVRSFLAAGLPLAFGFPVPSSIDAEPDIPYRPAFDDVVGGQAAVAVGYDDYRRGVTRGALLILTSWGDQWGEAGYGWLPYAYVEERLAVDFWCLLRPDWLKSGEFQRPSELEAE